jgi:hypothetical protein
MSITQRLERATVTFIDAATIERIAERARTLAEDCHPEWTSRRGTLAHPPSVAEIAGALDYWVRLGIRPISLLRLVEAPDDVFAHDVFGIWAALSFKPHTALDLALIRAASTDN